MRFFISLGQLQLLNLGMTTIICRRALEVFLTVRYFILIMFILQKLRTVVSKVDMFSSSGILRYNDDASYQTFTGGLFSLGIILTVIVGFFSMISETVNRTAIESNLNIISRGNPPAYNITTNSENMFMFGVQIQSMDLEFYYNMNGPRRYFDVSLRSYELEYGIQDNQDYLQMVQCTDEHWKMMPEIVSQKDVFAYNTWLCPQVDAKFLIEGSFYSNTYKYILISVTKCTNASNPSRPCHPQNQIDDLFQRYGNFYFTINYINTMINPSEVVYKSYYMESMEYVIFSKDIANEKFWLFSDYQIQTDSSIWPYQNLQSETGILVPTKSQGLSYSIDSEGTYVTAYFIKSMNSLTYRRQVQKLSVVFSYIGGLIGAASAFLFIIKSYTDMSLQVSIAKSLFEEKEIVCQITEQLKSENDDKSKTNSKQLKINLFIKNRANNLQLIGCCKPFVTHFDYYILTYLIFNQLLYTTILFWGSCGKRQRAGPKQQIKNEKGFNLMTFVKLHIYAIFKDFRCTENWTHAKELKQFRDEIGKHLDIKNLLRRIINIQRYLSYVFDQKQLACLRHLQEIKFDEIKRLRMFFAGQSDQEEANQIEQSTISDSIVYKVSNIACNQLIEPSPTNQFASQSQSPSKLSDYIQGSKPHLEAQNPQNKEKTNNRLRNNQEGEIGVLLDSLKIRQYFTDLKMSAETNTISRRILENAKRNFIETQQNSSSLSSKSKENQKKSYIQAVLISEEAFE